MKTTIKVLKEVEIKSVKVDVAVRYDDEDIPFDFPFRDGDMWSGIIDVDSGRILDWPIGQIGRLNMKVCDEGSYFLLDEKGDTVLLLENDYVPNKLIPGRYGDYIDLVINEQGVVTNWPKNPSISDFLDDED